MKDEKSLVIVKHDGVSRGLVGKIISRIERVGYKLIGFEMIWLDLVGFGWVWILKFEWILFDRRI